MTKRMLWSVLAVVGFLVAGTLHASDACDRLLRQWIDEGKAANLAEAQYNAPLERLAQLERTYGDAAVTSVDTVFKAADTGRAPKLMEQFLEKRTPEEARKLFDVGGGFGAEGKKGLTRAAGLATVDGIEPGKTAHRIVNVSDLTLSDVGKDTTFRDLGELIASGVPGPSGPGGVDGLFKKAGEQIAGANYGGILEVQGSAWIRRNANTYGSLEMVFVDSGGPGALNKIDTLSAFNAFQMKSKNNPAAVLQLGTDVPVEDLSDLAQQAASLGKEPILLSSNPVSPDVVLECQLKGIEVVIFSLVR